MALGKKVIFVIDFPEIGIEPKSCTKRAITITKKSVSDCSVSRGIVDDRQSEYRRLIDEIMKRVPKSVMIYDPISAFCDSKKCYGKRDGLIYYYDSDHLNTYGMELLIKDFQKWFEKKAR